MGMHFRRWLSFAILLCISSCSQTPVEETALPGTIPVPEITGDGWEVAPVESVGMDPEILIRLLDRLEQLEDHRVHSLLVVKDQKLVFEKYYPGLKFNLGQYTGATGYDREDLHVLCSATKSFTSALVGIAIDKRLIQSVDETVFDFYPEYADLLAREPAKGGMTIAHLLTMTSGLTYDDESLPYTDRDNDMNRFFSSSDPIRFLLAKPLFAEPGSVFDYDNCNTNILGHIIGLAADQRIDTFAQANLFDKLGITRTEWQLVRNNVVLCSGDLHLRPRDMAKFGLLFLNRGEWNGEQIVSSEWCDISTAVFLNPNDYNSEFPWADGYGYQWWQKTFTRNSEYFHTYFAFGWGGQLIMDVPELNMVFVMTAGNWYEAEKISPFTIVSGYIIPSAAAGKK